MAKSPRSARALLTRGAVVAAGCALTTLSVVTPASATPADAAVAPGEAGTRTGGPWVQEGAKDCGNPYMHIRIDVQATGKVWLDWVDGDWNSPYVRSTLVQEAVTSLRHTVHADISKGRWRLRTENPWGPSQPDDQLGIEEFYVNCELNGS